MVRDVPNSVKTANVWYVVAEESERTGLRADLGRPSRIAVFDRFNQAVAELHSSVGGLPLPIEGEEIWADIWYEETHNSTALEGNTLILKEVKTLLDEKRVVGDKEFRAYLEVQGYSEAASGSTTAPMKPPSTMRMATSAT